jgi:hypothetical protein
MVGPGSSVGVATGYGLDGLGIESRWGEIFRTCPHRPWGPPSLLYNGYRVFPGVKSGRSLTLTPHPFLVPWSRKSRAIPPLPLWAERPVQSLSACTRVHFTVRPVQSLSACTRVHFTLLRNDVFSRGHAFKRFVRPHLHLPNIFGHETLFNSINIYEIRMFCEAARGGVVWRGTALQVGSRGFDSRWCHWNFSLT